MKFRYEKVVVRSQNAYNKWWEEISQLSRHTIWLET